LASGDTISFGEGGGDWFESGKKLAVIERDELTVDYGAHEVNHAIGRS
jgi:hypothetical protein